MGFFDGILEVAISPIKVVTKTVDSAINDDWEDIDVFTLGASKVVKSVGAEAKDINDKFDD